LKESYEKTQKKMEGQVNRLVKDVLKKADIATSDDLKSLQREIQGLKKELKTAKAAKAAKTSKSGKAAPARVRSRAKPSS
jgi:polyhydroxyalkanoate synthesis regulator phasin